MSLVDVDDRRPIVVDAIEGARLTGEGSLRAGGRWKDGNDYRQFFSIRR